MSSSLSHYFNALERLKTGKTNVVPKGSRINNDNVALEAGRGKGSIKKSRPVFFDLIAEIEAATAEQDDPKQKVAKRLDELKGKAEDYRAKWEQALSREVSLLHEVYELKRELVMLRGGDVLPIRGNVQAKCR